MMAPARTRGVTAAEGLRRIRLAERRRLSRLLHDEAGPALCAAGLAAELLRGTLGELSKEQEELFERLGGALDGAVEMVRRLSQEASPELAERRGLEGALRLLAEVYGARLRIGAEPEAAGREGALCELVRDALLAAEGGVEIGLEGPRLEFRAASFGDAAVREALAAAAREAGFGFSVRRSKGTVIIEIQTGGKR